MKAPELRIAAVSDAPDLYALYQTVYRGRYSDPLMGSSRAIRHALHRSELVWVVAKASRENSTARLVGALAYEGSAAQRLARVFGGAVLPEYRGGSLLEKMMSFGREALERRSGEMEVIYAMTRTASPAPQLVTEKLGYKELGILPNVHKTEFYETHCLSAWFHPRALARRKADFPLHPAVHGIYQLVARECGLPDLRPVPDRAIPAPAPGTQPPPELELLEAPRFTENRFRRLGSLPLSPFLKPNALLISPGLSVEIFVALEESDGACTIVAFRAPARYRLRDLMKRALERLRERGFRYVELSAPADDPGLLEEILQAHFVPCAYFPSFQERGTQRVDCVFLSKTFEALDFSHLHLTRKSSDFLTEYAKNWTKYYLRPGEVLPPEAGAENVH